MRAPEGYPTLADGGIPLSLPASDDPGPAADCTHGYPSDAASFETSARRLPPTTDLVGWPTPGKEPVLNAAGTAIAFGAGTHEVRNASSIDVAQGHLVRWVGNDLTWLGQPGPGVVFPTAVGCDGLTVLGETSYPLDDFRWKRDSGYEGLMLGARTLSRSGDAIFSFELRDQKRIAVRRLDGADAEVLFELPPNAPGLAFSRGGDAILFGEPPAAFLKVGTADAVPVALDLDASCAIIWLNGVSADGAVIGGTSCGFGLRYFVWTEAAGTRMLPEHYSLTSIAPGAVAVGQYANAAQGDAGVYRGIVWDPTNGVRYLDELLAEHGVTVPESVGLRKVTDVSEDGRVFTGTCADARDTGRANIFRAVLPAGVFD